MRKRVPILLLFCLSLFVIGQAQVSKTINVTTPGTLSTLLTATELNTVTDLTVTGNIDGRDFLILKDKMPALTWLDISTVSIKEYSHTEYYGGYSIVTFYAANTVKAVSQKLTTILLPKTATEIEGLAFYNSNISSVTIPKSVIRIGNYAFQSCKSLTQLIIQDAPVNICIGTFSYCKALNNVILGDSLQSISEDAFNTCTSLEEVKIPSSLKYIEGEVFQNCTKLRKIQFPATISNIGSYMFDGCINLTDVNIPATVTSINEGAFKNCTTLNHIDIPNSVTYIASSAFANCTGFKKIVLPYSITNIDCSAFVNCTALDTVINKSYVPQLEYTCNFFYGVDLSKKVLVVPYMTKTLYQAINYWQDFGTIYENTKGVYLGNKNRFISDNNGDTIHIKINAKGEWTSTCNQSWVSLDKQMGKDDGTITVSVTKNDSISVRKAEIIISDYSNTPQKITLTQHGKLITIVASVGNLANLISNSDKPNIDNLKVSGIIDASDLNFIKNNLPKLTALNLSDVKINEYKGYSGTYYYNEYLTYPKDELPMYAFSDKLVNLKVPTALKSFNNYCFGYTYEIKDLYVNFRNLSKFKISTPSMFTGNDTLNCILHVPFGTKNIYKQTKPWNGFKNIFESPYSLYLDNDTVKFNTKTGNTLRLKVYSNINWDAQSNQQWLSLRKISGTSNDSLIITVLPNTDYKPRTATISLTSNYLETLYCTVIQDGNVLSYTITAGNLQTIIPTNIKKDVTNLVLSGTMDARDFRVIRDSIPNLIKLDISKIRIVYYKGVEGTMQDSYFPTILPVTFPANEIPAQAFKRENYLESSKILNTVILPDSTTSIGYKAFFGCLGLTDMKITDLITTINDGAFEYCISLTNFEIPKKITYLGGSVFFYCTNLNSVNINSSLTAISGSLFYSCTNLTSLTMPSTVTSIGSSAFNGCKSLKNLLLPTGVKQISDNAFAGCSGLTEFTIPSSVTTIGSWCFADCHSLTKIIAYGHNPANITLGRYVFSINDMYSNPPPLTCNLIVPAGTKSLYAAADQWKDFFNIKDTLITITDPILIINKMVDGNVNAGIVKIGVLQGVQSIDLVNLVVTATAKYDNANVGIDKTITVVYTVSGSAAWKYPPLENYVITNAKISDYITLSALPTPTPGCVGSSMNLSYTLLTGTPTQYKITFNAAALSAGMQNISYQTLSLTGSSGVVSFAIPSNTQDGTYTGILKMNNELNVESPDYPFTFTVNVSSDNIITKFKKIVLFNNFSNRFTGYQWYKNGVEIAGATKQFYTDPNGLIGSYSLKLTTTAGTTVYSCTKVLNIPPSKVAVNTFPNPVRQNESCAVELSGITDDELKDTNLSVYNMQGICVYQSSMVANVNKLKLPVCGVYIGHIIAAGTDYVFKLIVAK